ncbi:MAG: TraU family protein [Aliarcobacter sp.]|nr:TraU family protein [Aliarcobacter sp.]
MAASLIYKLHRQLILWGSWGQAGLCGYYPAPIWRKSAYRLQIVTPILSPYAKTTGTTGMMWSFGENPPFCRR